MASQIQNCWSRYSLIVEKDTLPGELTITAVSAGGEIMVISHREHHTIGLQFHPESILTMMDLSCSAIYVILLCCRCYQKLLCLTADITANE